MSLHPLTHPARVIPLAFVGVTVLGTLLLSLPIAREADRAAPFITALFTATSAACISGLAVVDTASYWSPFGEVVIFGLFQVGGFGIMTGATLLGLLISRRLRLTQRRILQAETRSLTPADVRRVMHMVLAVMLTVVAVVAIILTLRLHVSYGDPWSPTTPLTKPASRNVRITSERWGTNSRGMGQGVCPWAWSHAPR